MLCSTKLKIICNRKDDLKTRVELGKKNMERREWKGKWRKKSGKWRDEHKEISGKESEERGVERT